MKKRPSLILLVILTVVNAGCGSPGGEQPPSPSPTVSPNATPPVPPPPSPQAKTPNPQKSPTNLKALGLIPSTRPDQRLKEITAGRNNPFALMGIKVLVDPKAISSSTSGGKDTPTGSGTTTPTETPPGSGPQSPTGKPPGTDPFGPLLDSGPTTGKSSKTNQLPKGVLVASKAQVKPPEERRGNFCSGQSPDKQVTIKIPGLNNIQPEDAQGVLVSGIINFRSNPAAIILPRGESLEMTVRPGAVISQGKVKVVAIDAVNESVLFQQYDKLVSRKVGEEPIVIKSEANPEQEVVARPQGPDGFGLVRGLMLDKVSLDKVTVGDKGDESSRRLYGTLCNDSKKTVSLNRVKVQIQDAKTNNILDANWNRINESDATLEPGQRVEFDFEVPKLRGREAKDIYVKLINWS